MITRKRTHGKAKRRRRTVVPLHAEITIAGAARALGVATPHLWMVLHGQRVSHRLVARYRGLGSASSMPGGGEVSR